MMDLSIQRKMQEMSLCQFNDLIFRTLKSFVSFGQFMQHLENFVQFRVFSNHIGTFEHINLKHRRPPRLMCTFCAYLIVSKMFI